LSGPQGTQFRIWSTRARRASVAVVDPSGAILRETPMEPAGDGVYQLFDAQAHVGTLYKLRINDQLFPDPYARSMPYGVHGPARVTASDYPWRHAHRRVPITSRFVLYELHVGTFTPQGSFLSAAERFAELAELGVTALELMPVSSFPGSRGWGYDGVGHFAPHAGYGEPEDLKALVDRAHELGMSVLLDVVYNHFGPDGNYLGAYSPEYFTDRIPTPWGQAPDYRNPHMRALVLDNARYWLEEFRFDGLRLDATHEVHDDSERHILAELAEQVHALPGRPLLIAEDERNDASLVTQLGLDAVWSDDFHHQLRVLLAGDRDGYYGGYRREVSELARVIERGWLYEGQRWPLSGQPRGTSAEPLRPANMVYCVQNHDQIGNRALGERLHHQLALEACSAAAMLLLFLPAAPLLFMGQEWAASSPFLYFTDHEPELGRKVTEGRRKEFGRFEAFSGAGQERIPDPQDEATFRRSVLDWDERSRPEHAQVLEVHARMLRLRRSDPVLGKDSRLAVGNHGQLLWVHRWNDDGHRLLVMNFGEPASLGPVMQPGQRWTAVLASGHGAVHGDHLQRHAALLLSGG
jgi:maltooligosyltrehalose trehalohydrolase